MGERSENENEMSDFFFAFLLCQVRIYLPRYDKYGPNLGETGQAVQVR